MGRNWTGRPSEEGLPSSPFFLGVTAAPTMATESGPGHTLYPHRISYPQQPTGKVTATAPLPPLQMSKLKLQEVKPLAQGHRQVPEPPLVG